MLLNMELGILPCKEICQRYSLKPGHAITSSFLVSDKHVVFKANHFLNSFIQEKQTSISLRPVSESGVRSEIITAHSTAASMPRPYG